METQLQQRADFALQFFKKDKRANGNEIWRRVNDSPHWVAELCRAAHGDMLPDDWRYTFIVEALDALAIDEDPDDIDTQPDTHTARLLQWLASSLDRPEYCDEAVREFGVPQPCDIVHMIGLGQYAEKAETLSLVRDWLENEFPVDALQATVDDEDEEAPNVGR